MTVIKKAYVVHHNNFTEPVLLPDNPEETSDPAGAVEPTDTSKINEDLDFLNVETKSHPDIDQLSALLEDLSEKDDDALSMITEPETGKLAKKIHLSISIIDGLKG